MIFTPPLIAAQLIRRYKRFCVEAQLPSGETMQGYCPNTGSMQSCADAGSTIFFLKEERSTRKLPYTWELTQTPSGYVGINTHRTNALVAEALRQKWIPELSHYPQFKAEVSPYDRSTRLDFFLTESSEKPPAYLEVKNTTLYHKETHSVMFPDALSTRAQKHLLILSKLAQEGHGAYLLFVVNRPEGQFFRPAEHIDANYAKLLRQASEQGVQILAYRTQATPHSITLDGSQVAVKL